MARYIEVDFTEVTTKKAMAVRKSKQLCSVLGDEISLSQGGTALHSPVYHLLPCDLRLPPGEALGRLLEPILSRSQPTLLLFECVLAYMRPDASSALLRWFVDYMDSGVLGCVVYEMFGLNDTFGKVMVNNLKERNVTLIGAEPFTTLDALKKRFYGVNFTQANAITLRDIRGGYLDRAEMDRVSQLELLDEVEELELVLSHYAVSWGVTRKMEWGLKKQMSTSQQEEE